MKRVSVVHPRRIVRAQASSALNARAFGAAPLPASGRTIASQTVAIATRGISTTVPTSTLASTVISGSELPSPVLHPSFEVVSHESVKEHSAVATLYRHIRTGAEILSVSCDEEEKVFGVVFRTPNDGDTGVAHVLEHSVLCGSRKYPVKEPFVALLKSSLQTYLNAMTYPDRTVYPVASPNGKDFYHLVDVYLDAVFHPRLQPWVLQQEGWHLEVAQPPPSTDASALPPSLSYKGVVYNEMKGVYSSPDTAHAYAADAALWPANVYGRSSGGDPLAIPQLTFADFTAFHERYYHPSNARVFFFGDDDVATRLATIESYFSGFEARADVVGHAAGARVAPQPLFTAPVRVSRPYPVEAEGQQGGEGEWEEGMEEGEEALELEAFEVEQGAQAGATAAHPSAGVPQAGSATASGVDVHEGAAAASASASGAPHSSLPVDEQVALASSAANGVPDKHEVTVNWVLHEAPAYPGEVPAAGGPLGPPDEVARYGLALLNTLLMRTQTSTLRKALSDSGLGSAVIGGGLDDGLQQATFSVGLKGVKGADVARVEELVLATLAKAADEGFAPDHLASSFNSVEFALREFATGGGPRGLSLFLAAIPGWIYGRDPIAELRFEAPMTALRRAVEADPAYFQGLIRTHLLGNPHRATVHMYPDPAYTAQREAEEAARLAETAARLTPAQTAEIAETAASLLQRQATPDLPEAVATIPTLSVSDLPTGIRRIPKAVGVMRLGQGGAPAQPSASPSSSAAGGEEAWRVASPAVAGSVGGRACRFLSGEGDARGATAAAASQVTVASGPASPAHASAPVSPSSSSPAPEYLQHEQPTNGVAYASLYFDLSRLAPRLLPLVPLFSWALSSCGTATIDEVRLSHLLGMHTGGVGGAASVVDVPRSRTSALPLLTFSGKALGDKAGRMGELMLEILTTGRLDARERIVHHLRETIAGHESALVTSGGRYASLLLGAQYSKSAWISEVWGGLTGLATARALLHRITSGSDGGFEAVNSDLEAIRRGLLTQCNVMVSAIGDAPCLAALDGALKGVVGGLPASPDARLLEAGALLPGTPRRAEGWGWSPVDATGAWTPPTATGDRALPLWALPPSLVGADGLPPSRIALVVPTQVNYVVKAGPAYDPAGDAGGGGPAPGGAEVLAGFLRTGYLWERVRVQGGAYGGNVSLNRHTGMVGFSSYRDPNLGATLDVYDGTPGHLRGLVGPGADLPGLASELGKAVISTVGSIDAPMAPVERGEVSLARHLVGITEDQLQVRRTQILATAPGDVEPFAAAVQRVATSGRVAAVTSEAALKAHTGAPFHAVINPLQMHKQSQQELNALEVEIKQLRIKFDAWQGVLHSVNTATDAGFGVKHEEFKKDLAKAEDMCRKVKMAVANVERNRVKFSHIDDRELNNRKAFVQGLENAVAAMHETFHGRETQAKLDGDRKREMLSRQAVEVSAAGQRANAYNQANSGFMGDQQQAQSQIRREQDVTLDKMSNSLDRLGDMARAIDSELAEQDVIIADIDRGVDEAQGKMDATIKGVQKLLKTKDRCQLATIGILVLIFVIVAIIAIS